MNRNIILLTQNSQLKGMTIPYIPHTLQFHDLQVEACAHNFQIMKVGASYLWKYSADNI